MNKSNNVNSFNEFWPKYLAAHRHPASLALHVAGMLLSVVTAAALLSCGMVFFLVLAVIPAQVGAWLGHKLSPRTDRISEEHPDWAAVADVKMFALAVTGRLGREIARISEHPSFSVG